MKFFLVGLYAIAICCFGVSSAASIRRNIGSAENNGVQNSPAESSPKIFPTRNGRHRTFRRLSNNEQEIPMKSQLKSNNENSENRLNIPITTYRNRDFTTPGYINNRRQVPHFPGPPIQQQNAPPAPRGREANPRGSKSRNLPQTLRFSPDPQPFGLPQTLTQQNGQRNFASRTLFRQQPLGESNLVGIIPFGAPPITPFNINSFLPRPLEEDFEDYELFSYHPLTLIRQPFLPHRPHPVLTDRLAGIGFSLPSPIRLYQSLQVSDGANALSALKNPLVINAKGTSRRILDPGDLQTTREDHRVQPSFFREQPLIRPPDSDTRIHINPDRPPSRFSVEIIGGSTQRENDKQIAKRFRVPSYVTGIPPHNHPLLDRFVMGSFLDS